MKLTSLSMSVVALAAFAGCAAPSTNHSTRDAYEAASLSYSLDFTQHYTDEHADEHGSEHAAPSHSYSPGGHAQDHGGGHGAHHANHVALFLGSTDSEGHDGETYGLDYERRVSDTIGYGVIVDRAEGDVMSTVYGAALFYHLNDEVTFLVAPGIEHAHHEDEFMIRVGVNYGFPVGNYIIAPTIAYDMISGGATATVYGISFGMGF